MKWTGPSYMWKLVRGAELWLDYLCDFWNRWCAQ